VRRQLGSVPPSAPCRRPPRPSGPQPGVARCRPPPGRQYPARWSLCARSWRRYAPGAGAAAGRGLRGAGLCALLEEAARRRLDALPLEAVAAQVAVLEPGELLALTRHLRPRLVPSEEPPAAAVAERIVRMSAEELQGLVRGLRERLAAEA